MLLERQSRKIHKKNMENNDILKYVFQHLQSSNGNLPILSQSFKRYRRVLFVKRNSMI